MAKCWNCGKLSGHTPESTENRVKAAQRGQHSMQGESPSQLSVGPGGRPGEGGEWASTCSQDRAANALPTGLSPCSQFLKTTQVGPTSGHWSISCRFRISSAACEENREAGHRGSTPSADKGCDLQSWDSSRLNLSLKPTLCLLPCVPLCKSLRLLERVLICKMGISPPSAWCSPWG